MIEKANPRARAVAIAGMLAIVVIGVVLIGSADFYRSAVIDWIARDPARSRSRAVSVSVALAAAVILPALGASAYLWRVGVRVVRDERFPPRDTMLIVDMLVVEG